MYLFLGMIFMIFISIGSAPATNISCLAPGENLFFSSFDNYSYTKNSVTLWNNMQLNKVGFFTF